MGTINYKTSNYITLGVHPYDPDDFINDKDFLEELNILYGDTSECTVYEYINMCYEDDRENIKHELEKHNFYYYHITIESGYYEGFSLNIENNFPVCLDSYEDRQAAQKEITEIKSFLLTCAGMGLVQCFPGWCTGYNNYLMTIKGIQAATKEMREELRSIPTWKQCERKVTQ